QQPLDSPARALANNRFRAAALHGGGCDSDSALTSRLHPECLKPNSLILEHGSQSTVNNRRPACVQLFRELIGGAEQSTLDRDEYPGRTFADRGTTHLCLHTL